MPVRNAHWYGQNEGRAYPVDDSSSGVDDAGRRLPPDVVCDANLRWPAILGRHAFLSAVSVTDSLVTLTVQAADTPTDAGGFAPLAVLSVRKPVVVGKMYAVSPQADGVGGWVVFGTGVNGENYGGRFSTPAQALLTPRAARAYRTLPVSSLQSANAADRLRGVVTLKATPPLALAKETRLLDGAHRDCLVVRLVDSEGAEGFPVPDDAALISGFKQKSVFQQFSGPCAGRPESNTCGCPGPIEFVNAVAPDCNGVLTIEFLGCAVVSEIVGGGVAVSCDLGLVDACLPPQLPSSDGLLPSEYDPVNVPVPPDVPPVPPEEGVSDSFVPDAGLPYHACFVAGYVPLTVRMGTWQTSPDNGPTEVCEPVTVSDSISGSWSVVTDGSFETVTAADRNVATYEVDATTVYRRAVTEVLLRQGPPGAKHNAHLVVNHRESQSSPGEYVYLAAEVDYDTQTFGLVRFNGTAFQAIAPASVVAPGIQLDKWYRVTATCLPDGVNGDVAVTVRLESVTDPGVVDVTVSASLSTYQPSDGKFGVGTNRAVTAFAYLTIDEAH